jgi:hypothetical protein
MPAYFDSFLAAFMPILALVVELAFMTALVRLMNRLAYRNFGERIYLLLMWPGVAVHELSHAAACVLTRTRLVEVKLFSPRKARRGEMLLGYVKHEQPKNRLAGVVIGAAPFFGGTAVLALLFRLAFPATAGRLGAVAASVAGPLQLARRISDFAVDLVQEAATRTSWDAAWPWLAVWLMVAVAAHLAPSRSDLEASATTLLAAVAGVLPLLFFLFRFWPPAFLVVASSLGSAAAALAGLLAVGLAGVAVATVVIAAIALMAHGVRNALR